MKKASASLPTKRSQQKRSSKGGKRSLYDPSWALPITAKRRMAASHITRRFSRARKSLTAPLGLESF
jgi:hypothetical protein